MDIMGSLSISKAYIKETGQEIGKDDYHYSGYSNQLGKFKFDTTCPSCNTEQDFLLRDVRPFYDDSIKKEFKKQGQRLP